MQNPKPSPIVFCCAVFCVCFCSSHQIWIWNFGLFAHLCFSLEEWKAVDFNQEENIAFPHVRQYMPVNFTHWTFKVSVHLQYVQVLLHISANIIRQDLQKWTAAVNKTTGLLPGVSVCLLYFTLQDPHMNKHPYTKTCHLTESTRILLALEGV